MKPAQISERGPSDSPKDLPRQYPPTRPEASPPPAPSRVRVVRPQLYRGHTTGSLAPDVRDALVGLTVSTDDEGFLLWNLDELAAAIYPFGSPKRRVADLERRAAKLVDAGLLVIHDCGCAEIPVLRSLFGVKGGAPTKAVWTWHWGHSGGLRSATDDSVSVSASSSVSESISASASSRVRAGTQPWTKTRGGGSTPCSVCLREIASFEEREMSSASGRLEFRHLGHGQEAA